VRLDRGGLLGLNTVGFLYDLAPADDVPLDEHSLATSVLSLRNGAAVSGNLVRTNGCSSATATASRSFSRIPCGRPLGA
jgi:hypothetical protein